jgi:hypothetical protein
MRIATGSKIFFSLERRGGGWFQKMVLRKIVQINAPHFDPNACLLIWLHQGTADCKSG